MEEKSQEEKNAQRATRLAQEGQYTRALKSLVSSGLAKNNRDTLNQMKAKHPAAQTDSNFQPQASTAQMTFSPLQVAKSIKSFHKGSAPGPSGLRAEHLKVAVKRAPPARVDKATEAITKIVNIMAAGHVPDEVAPYLCGARLHAANKKDGGIRPIAVGNLLRRLTAKCFSSALADRSANKFSPHQLGVGIRGGLEALVHAVRQVVEDEQGNPDLWVLQADLVNAFNRVDRDTAFKELEKTFPDCLKWVLTCYGCQAELLLGDNIILSEVGFHQGDPLASLLFSLVLQPIIERIQQEIPSLKVNGWYLDDGTIVGTKEELRRAVDIILEDGPARGLQLSTAATVLPPSQPKCTVWSPAGTPNNGDPLGCGIPSVEQPGIILLGAPLGSQEFVTETIASSITKISKITEKLPLLEDAHTEFVLLRSCLSLPKVMYTLRTTDPTPNQRLWQIHDNTTREAVTRILGAPIDDTQWAQAKLPVSLGGLGLRAAEDHSPAAFLSSILNSHTLKNEILGVAADENPATLPQDALLLLSEKQDEEATSESLHGMSQKAISLKIDLHNHNLLSEHLTQSGDTREIARFASVSLPHAGDWLVVSPLPALGLHLRTAEFVVSVQYRLGCPMYTTAGQCPACGHFSDMKGDHAMNCGNDGERIARHNHLRDALHSTAVQACLAPTKEERALIPGNNSKPADVLIPHWTSGKDTALDVTVVNPLQSAMVDQAAVTAGHALNQAYKRKMRGTGEACRGVGIVFVPLPMESLGGWHEQAVLQIKKLGAALARQTGQEESEAVSHLFQRLSVLLVKGNAALFLNRKPTFPAPEVDGVQ